MIKKISFVLLSGVALFITLNFTLALYNTTNNFTNIFKSNGYTFLIDGTGGTFRNENITVISNSTTLPTPYRNGYTFLGYSENKIDLLFWTISVFTTIIGIILGVKIF